MTSSSISGCQISARPVPIPRVAGEEVTPHHLHVLLRHRLLRESGGFEGPFAARKDFQPDRLAITNRPEVGESIFKVQTTTPSSAT